MSGKRAVTRGINHHDLIELLDHLKKVRQRYAGLSLRPDSDSARLKAEHDENLRIAVDIKEVLIKNGFIVMPELLEVYL